MTAAKGPVSWIILCADLLIVLVALLALPAVRTDAVAAPDDPTAEQAVAHVERVWERASREPGPSRLVRYGAVGEPDHCSIMSFRDDEDIVDDGSRVITWRGPADGGGADLLRSVEQALLASGLEPPLEDRRSDLRELQENGYSWYLALEDGRATVTAETPCLRVRLPAAFQEVRDPRDYKSLLEALRDEDDLSKPVRVTHYMAFAKADDQRAAAAATTEAEWETVSGRTVDGGLLDFGGTPVVMARRTLRLTPEVLRRDRSYFEDLCRQFSCTYEGWDTSDIGYDLR